MTRTLLLSLSLFLAACLLTGCACSGADSSSSAPSSSEDRSASNDEGAESGAAEAPAKEDPPAKSEPVEGSALNKFFPGEEVDGYERIFTKEKDGFAEATLKKDGEEVATLTISDTNNNPQARSKFESPDDKVDGHPAVQFGKNGSSVLVADRFQGTVTSQTLDHADRLTWLGKFDLAGLSSLE